MTELDFVLLLLVRLWNGCPINVEAARQTDLVQNLTPKDETALLPLGPAHLARRGGHTSKINEKLRGGSRTPPHDTTIF